MSYEASSSVYQSSSDGNEFGGGEFDLYFLEKFFKTYTPHLLVLFYA
jgi:hypothetical protein